MVLLLLCQKKLEFIDHGVVYAEGRKCSMKGMASLSALEKISEAELEVIRADFDPIETPPGQYRIQPKNQGENSIQTRPKCPVPPKYRVFEVFFLKAFFIQF